MENYQNDGDVYYRKIPLEDAQRAAEVWGEGYKPLIDLLETCINNDIQTLASCAGHPEKNKNSYILFDGESDLGNYLLQEMKNESYLSLISCGRFLISNKIYIGFHCEKENRNIMFGDILKHVKSYIERSKYLESETIIKDDIEKTYFMEKFLEFLRSSNFVGYITKFQSNINGYYFLSECTDPKLKKYVNEKYLEDDMINRKFSELCEKYGSTKPIPVIDFVQEVCCDEKISISDIGNVSTLLQPQNINDERKNQHGQQGDENK